VPDARVVVGAPLSLTGRYGFLGRLAAAGLRQVVQAARTLGGIRMGEERLAPELHVVDDGGTRAGVRGALEEVAEADLLVGPYGSDLVDEAARWAAGRGRVLWNHGGSADEVERVGVGYGKAREVPLAISKAVDDAKKNMFVVPRHGTTITHEVLGRFDAARVLLRPASEGTGVIAGGGVRAVLELAGVRDVLAKSLGTTNPINMLKATVDGLKRLRRPEDVAAARGLTVSQVLPVGAKVEDEAAAPPEPVAEAAEEPQETESGEDQDQASS